LIYQSAFYFLLLTSFILSACSNGGTDTNIQVAFALTQTTDVLSAPELDNDKVSSGESPDNSDQTGNRANFSISELADGRYELHISGGYETNPVDGGRPVNLIAGGLNIEPQVFRDAFSNVTPEEQGHLNEETARRNKAILLEALGPYGITNELLDRVSNYYRYRPDKGETWPVTPAAAYAEVQDGNISFFITQPGSGYNTVPAVSIPGVSDVNIFVTIAYDTDLATNGQLAAVSVEN